MAERGRHGCGSVATGSMTNQTGSGMYVWDDAVSDRAGGWLALCDHRSVGLSIRPARLDDDDIANHPEVSDMETLFVWIVVIVVIAALVALDAAALIWGADSRDLLPDDHRR